MATRDAFDRTRRAALLAGLLVLGCGGSGSGGPNVAVIVVDTLRADHLATYGYPVDTAPFLTSLAGRSVVFDTAWSTSSWTAPATASLFTGLYPSQHGVLTGLSLFRKNKAVVEFLGQHPDADPDDPVLREMLDRTARLNRIPAELETLPELFANRGYRTYGVADNVNVCEAEGFTSGFGRFEGGDYVGAPAVVDRVLEWKDELRSSPEPYFLYVHLMDPHQPYHDRDAQLDDPPPAPEDRAWLDEAWGEPCNHCEEGRSLSAVRVARYREIEDDARRERLRRHAEALLVACYDSEIRYVDRELERLFGELELERDAIVVFTSDHGEELGDHGLVGHPFSLHAELVGVPLLVRLPGAEGPRGRRSMPASLVDVLPTLRELIGAPPDPRTAGRSLVDALHDRDEDDDRPLLAMRADEHPLKTHWKHAVRSGGDKLILESPDRRARLFDLAADPRELQDLATEHPDRVRELEALLDELRRGLPPRPREFGEVELDDDLLDHLRVLGYAGDDPDDSGDRAENPDEPDETGRPQKR